MWRCLAALLIHIQSLSSCKDVNRTFVCAHDLARAQHAWCYHNRMNSWCLDWLTQGISLLERVTLLGFVTCFLGEPYLISSTTGSTPCTCWVHACGGACYECVKVNLVSYPNFGRLIRFNASCNVGCGDRSSMSPLFETRLGYCWHTWVSTVIIGPQSTRLLAMYAPRRLLTVWQNLLACSSRL